MCARSSFEGKWRKHHFIVTDQEAQEINLNSPQVLFSYTRFSTHYFLSSELTKSQTVARVSAFLLTPLHTHTHIDQRHANNLPQMTKRSAVLSGGGCGRRSSSVLGSAFPLGRLAGVGEGAIDPLFRQSSKNSIRDSL